MTKAKLIFAALALSVVGLGATAASADTQDSSAIPAAPKSTRGWRTRTCASPRRCAPA